MNAREQGFLLLSSQLGNPDRRPLTMSQLRILAVRAQAMMRPAQERDLNSSDLSQLGYGQEMSARIVDLLAEEDLLRNYLRRGAKAGCTALTRVSAGYPARLRHRLGLDSPGCLWAKGDLSLLERPAIALAGSRDITPRNRDFAAEVGRQAALQGYVLISGNARGADRVAQDACLAAGGSVIAVVADALQEHQARERVLYLSEEDFDAPFSTQRALSRNRVIHSLGCKTFIAQSAFQTGGTWNGTVKNLRGGWTPVFCFDDGSKSARMLAQMGAVPVGLKDLADFEMLQPADTTFFNL